MISVALASSKFCALVASANRWISLDVPRLSPADRAFAQRANERLARQKWQEFNGWLQVHQATRWIFRGEPKCKTALRPTIGRGRNWTPEREFLLYEMFEQRSRMLKANNGPSSFIETLAWAQHHGLPTRLLDWTTNPLAAAYFAVQPQRAGDAMVHAVDAAEVGFFRSSDLATPSLARGHGQSRFIDVPPVTPRMTAQRGLFSWHHAPDANWKPAGRDRDRDCFLIPMAARPYFLSRLSQLGFDAASVMMDLDGLCTSLRWWHQSGLATPSTIGRRIAIPPSRASGRISP